MVNQYTKLSTVEYWFQYSNRLRPCSFDVHGEITVTIAVQMFPCGGYLGSPIIQGATS